MKKTCEVLWRLVKVITFPVWVPVIVITALIVWIGFTIFGCLYWIWTGSTEVLDTLDE